MNTNSSDFISLLHSIKQAIILIPYLIERHQQPVLYRLFIYLLSINVMNSLYFIVYFCDYIIYILFGAETWSTIASLSSTSKLSCPWKMSRTCEYDAAVYWSFCSDDLSSPLTSWRSVINELSVLRLIYRVRVSFLGTL